MRAELVRMGATPDEMYLAYLTAYAEARFFNDRKQLMQDGIHWTLGMFQQSNQWYTNPTDIATATREFLTALRKVPRRNSAIETVYQVQQWGVAAKPDKNSSLFWSSPETQNYANVIDDVKKIMADMQYFSNGGKSK